MQYFESKDYVQTIGVCSSCQSNVALGIIVAKSGYGKTHALKKYATMPRVIYIEGTETMNCKDIVRRIENKIGMQRSVQNSVTNTTQSLNSAFGTMQKAGAALTGFGTAITGACLATVKSTFETQNALGELASLGVTDLEAVESAAKSFSDTWAGTTKADFITASYDIKSGISSLTDEGVAQFTQLAALTGKATINETMESVSGVIQKGSEWITNNQELISTVMNVALKLGVVLVVLGSLLGIIGTIGKAIMGAKTAITTMKAAWTALSVAFAGTPIGWVVLAVVALVAAFVILWNKSEAFRNFWIELFDQVKGAVLNTWESLKPALQTLGENLMGLYEASKPILKIIGTIAGAIATLAIGQIVGIIRGIIAALVPLTNALSSLVSFATNVVNMIVALFRGDFSGAMDYAMRIVLQEASQKYIFRGYSQKMLYQKVVELLRWSSWLQR